MDGKIQAQEVVLPVVMCWMVWTAMKPAPHTNTNVKNQGKKLPSPYLYNYLSRNHMVVVASALVG